MPRGVFERKPKVESNNDVIEAQGTLPVTGSVKRDQLIKEVEPHTDMTRIDSKAEELKFMEEPVVIVIHESQSPNEEPVVHIGVNGDNVWIRRGVETKVRRKHVLNLLTARPISYSTVEGMDRDGAKTVNLKSRTSLKYPFAVIDDTQKGREWMRQISNAK